MGFRINRGIFQFKDTASDTFINKFKIDDRGDMVEVDPDGNAVTAYMKVGDKATDSNLLDGIDSGAFLRSNASDNVTGHTEWQDNYQIRLGSGADLRMWHDGNNHVFRSYHHGANYYFQLEDNEGTNRNAIQLVGNTSRSYVILYEDGNERLRTTSDGVTIGKLSVGATTGTWVTSNQMADSIGWNGNHGVYIGSDTTGSSTYVYGDGTFYKNGTNYSLIHSGTIGSQSVDNADKLDGSHRHEVGNRDYTRTSFYVDGEAEIYYPVLITPRGGYAFNRWSISRRYNWTAPWNPIGTGNHKGGLTFDFYWAADTAWGGNDKSIRIHQFSEQYTTMVGGIQLARTGGMIVWLRGGHAYYELQVDTAQATVDVKLEGWTDGSGTRFDPTDDVNLHRSSIWNNYPVRNGDDLYINNRAVATEQWTDDTFLRISEKAADSNLLDGIDSSGYVKTSGNQTITGTKRFSNSSIVIEGSHASISFIDNTSSADDFYLHANSNNFYVLRDTAGANVVDGGYDSPHPMQLEGDTNRAYFFGNMLNTAAYQPSSAFETAGASAIVNDRIETEIIPSITTAQSAANDAQAAADLAVATADTAEARANSAREDAAAAATAAAAAQTTADGKLGATAKAADSELLDGIDSGGFLRSNADDNVTGHTEWQDNYNIRLGNSADFRMYHSSNHTYFRNFNHAYGNIYWQAEDTEGTNHAMLYMISDTSRPYVKLYEDGGEKLRTKSTGVEVFGEVRVSNGIRSTSSGGYGIIRGYDNDNHFIVIRGAVTTGQSTLEITGAHKTTFVEHANESNEGWYFVSKASGNYTEKARIDGLGNIYSSNIITNQANIQSITSDGTIANDKGSYLHLGGWAVSRTHASAVLVNTAYRADYATSLFNENISRFTNDSGYITQGSVDALGEELMPQISTAQTTADEATSLARAAQTTADSKLGATAKAADSDKLDGYDWMQSGKNVRANEFYADNWFRNYNSGEGIYNEATAVHWYSDSTARWRHRSGSSSESWILMCTSNNAARGSFYANSSNQVGILDADNHWAVRVVHDSYVEFRDNNEVTFRVGQGGVSGNYGTVQTHGNGKGGYEGYSINGRFVWMSPDSGFSGIYNDTDNEWMTIWRRNGSTELHHNGSKKLETTSSGATVTGTMTATSFSGSGAGLTNLPIPDQRTPATLNGEPAGVIVSVNFNLDRGTIEFTLENGEVINGALAR